MTDLIASESQLESTTDRPSRLLSTFKSPLALAGLVGTTLIALAAVFAPALAPHDPTGQNLSQILAPPFWDQAGTLEFALGTDGLGRDVLSRILYGARNSLTISFFAMLLGSTLGLITGLLAGFFGGRLDSVIMRLGDVQLAFPFILLAIAVLGVVPNRSAWHIIVVLGIPGWIIYARVVRSRVMAEKEKNYVVAARATGASKWRRLFIYVFPSVWQVVPVIALLDFGFLIIMESTLSFLGLGLPPPAATWGGILAEGRRNMIVSPWLPILPGIAIVLTVLSINLLGDGMAKVIDPSGAKGGFRRLRPEPTPRADGPDEAPPLLRVRNLSVEFPDANGTISAVRNVGFDLQRGEILGVVGESGSGKSVTASAIVQLIDPPGRVTSGEILLDGEDVVQASDRRMRQLRGHSVAMIFQNPTASLNPVLTVGYQMREALRTIGIQNRDVKDTVVRVLTTVGIPDPKRVVRQYPFELSGGMNQRVMTAMALAAQPRLLIADEPTTALDTTTQEQILTELVDLARSREISLLLITHDIALVSQYADRILVLYAGEVCENGPTSRVISDPAHPYTRALLESVPRVEVRSDRLQAIPGEPPDPRALPIGCPFAARCLHVMDICRVEDPSPVEIASGQWTACHLWTEDRAEVMRS
ncbi:MAG TPA: dipeptide/oligopeptide/nickel ABC transporter permease/ATP-binding protein [Acidimicrobiia bacterium]|nr:dipeptide/oligopeptide/nickel ABC transporter permease/ATP-binding protein [Acidimicrobiia bacterium]